MKFIKLIKILWNFEILKFLKILTFFAIWLADWKWNIVSGWTTLKHRIDKNRHKPEYTSREVYSLHVRYTHSEVELRKCCLGQSPKSQILYHLINGFIYLWTRQSNHVYPHVNKTSTKYICPNPLVDKTEYSLLYLPVRGQDKVSVSFICLWTIHSTVLIYQ